MPACRRRSTDRRSVPQPEHDISDASISASRPIDKRRFIAGLCSMPRHRQGCPHAESHHFQCHRCAGRPRSGRASAISMGCRAGIRAWSRARSRAGSPPTEIGCVRIFELVTGATAARKAAGVLRSRHVRSPMRIIETPQPISNHTATCASFRVTDGDRDLRRVVGQFRLRRRMRPPRSPPRHGRKRLPGRFQCPESPFRRNLRRTPCRSRCRPAPAPTPHARPRR